MALNFKEIRKTVIDSVKAAIGSDLSQTTNPITQETYGMVLNTRPDPEIAVPAYPYAVLDVLSVRDTDWHTTSQYYDDELGGLVYETSKTIDFQVTIYGGDAISIGAKLQTAYRRGDIRAILLSGGLGLVRVHGVQILPELVQTDWLEVSPVQLSMRVNDIEIDLNVGSIESVEVDGVLEDNLSEDPLEIQISVTSNNNP